MTTSPPDLQGELVRVASPAMEEDALREAGLLEEFHALCALDGHDAEQQATALAAALAAPQSEKFRFTMQFRTVKTTHGARLAAHIRLDEIELPLRAALFQLVTPQAPPRSVLTIPLAPSPASISATLSPRDISAHIRIAAEHRRRLLQRIWQVRLSIAP